MAVYLGLLGIGLLSSQKQAIITEQGINWTWLLLQKTDISVSPTKCLLMLMYEKEKSQNTKELCVASSWENIFCLPNLVILIWKSVWENKYQTEHCHFQNLFCDCSLENTHSKTIEILVFFFFFELLEEKETKTDRIPNSCLGKDIIHNNCIAFSTHVERQMIKYSKRRGNSLIQNNRWHINPSVNAVWV